MSMFLFSYEIDEKVDLRERGEGKRLRWREREENDYCHYSMQRAESKVHVRGVIPGQEGLQIGEGRCSGRSSVAVNIDWSPLLIHIQ